MRRKDREITDVNEIIKIIEACEVCNLGLCLDDMPYVVPLNFGFEFENGKLTMYFHGAKEGKKLDIINKNKHACFSMTSSHEVVASKNAAEYTSLYQSVMGFGQIQVLDDLDEKLEGLQSIMRKYAPDRVFDFPVAVLEKTAVLKLSVNEFTGKRNPGK